MRAPPRAVDLGSTRNMVYGIGRPVRLITFVSLITCWPWLRVASLSTCFTVYFFARIGEEGIEEMSKKPEKVNGGAV